mmetsp:Transcript_23664/g.51651  ORF Transcript_23664/g.51651 Transcript_23664/m.51651 type:complete len:209 (+) Transcript_23664:91-717(+)
MLLVKNTLEGAKGNRLSLVWRRFLPASRRPSNAKEEVEPASTSGQEHLSSTEGDTGVEILGGFSNRVSESSHSSASGRDPSSSIESADGCDWAEFRPQGLQSQSRDPFEEQERSKSYKHSRPSSMYSPVSQSKSFSTGQQYRTLQALNVADKVTDVKQSMLFGVPSDGGGCTVARGSSLLTASPANTPCVDRKSALGVSACPAGARPA